MAAPDVALLSEAMMRRLTLLTALTSLLLVTDPAGADVLPPRHEVAPSKAATAIEIRVEEGACWAIWNDGGRVRVDCPPELVGKETYSEMKVAGGVCTVQITNVPGEPKPAPCPRVLVEKATPGELPPPSSGTSRGCHACEVGGFGGVGNHGAALGLAFGGALLTTAVLRRRRRSPRAE